MSLLPYDLVAGMFIKARPAVVVDRLRDWYREREVPLGEREASQSLSQSLPFLSNRVPIPNRALVLGVGLDWTVYLDNHFRQWFAVAVMTNLTVRIQTRAMFLAFDENSGAEFIFNEYRPDGLRNRHLQVYKDVGRWHYKSWGEPCDFERTNAYSNRVVRTRLTEEMLRSYGEALGVRFWQPDVYGKHVWFLEDGPLGDGGPDAFMRKLPPSLRKGLRLLWGGKPRA